MREIHEGTLARNRGRGLQRTPGGLPIRGLRFLPLIASALAAASSLTAQPPGQGDRAAERMQATRRVPKQPQARDQGRERANLALRSVSSRSTGPTVRFLVDAGPVSNVITMFVDLNGMMVQGSLVPVQAAKAPSEIQDLSNRDRLEDGAPRCVRREAGIRTTCRF